MIRRTGFTLIELLIVVAIIAILAAIAVPNFLEAQTRGKAARTRADQHALVLALECYFVDHNTYPLTDLGNSAAPRTAFYQKLRAWHALTTPVAYIHAARLWDPFNPTKDEILSDPCGMLQIGTGHENRRENSGFNFGFPRTVYATISYGPDQRDSSTISLYPFSYGVAYDPTNGTVSVGDIFRCGPGDKMPRGWRTGPPTPAQLGELMPRPF